MECVLALPVQTNEETEGTTEDGAPTPMPLNELAPPPDQDELFGGSQTYLFSHMHVVGHQSMGHICWCQEALVRGLLSCW